MTGTGQLLVLEVAAVILGACLGYVPGRILRRRERYQAEQDGYDACLDDYEDVLLAGSSAGRTVTGSGLATMPQPAASLEYERGGLASLAVSPPHPWQEQMAAELAPEALALQVPLPSVDEGPQRDVPEPATRKPGNAPDGGLELTGANGLGHPSPYTGPLTPAQRRRDKHKQRGQYAPLPGWTADPEHITASHWKPEGDRWMAEWRIEWQDDVAAVDEEIAAWTERQRAWLAADRWDRGARRLGAVA